MTHPLIASAANRLSENSVASSKISVNPLQQPAVTSSPALSSSTAAVTSSEQNVDCKIETIDD